jgi:hypothetical protein
MGSDRWALVSRQNAEWNLVKRMASGDPQSVWFQEMVEALRSRWHREMTFEAMIRLRDDLDEMLQRIRRERQDWFSRDSVSGMWAYR